VVGHLAGRCTQGGSQGTGLTGSGLGQLDTVAGDSSSGSLAILGLGFSGHSGQSSLGKELWVILILDLQKLHVAFWGKAVSNAVGPSKLSQTTHFTSSLHLVPALTFARFCAIQSHHLIVAS